MQRTKSKILSILLSLVMLLSLLPTTALAAYPDASNVFVDGGKQFTIQAAFITKAAMRASTSPATKTTTSPTMIPPPVS